jgi:kynurenine formamidase
MAIEGPSNWGRWGSEDERGAANLLTADVVLEACRVPTTGRVYSLGIPIRRDAPVAGNRLPPLHLMSTDGGDFAALGRNDEGSADDYLVIGTHATTHMDGLGHMWYGGRLYNGFAYTEVRSSGAARCGVEKVGGLVTRAHLLDFAEVECEEAGLIGPADVDRYLADHRQEIKRGDALLFRTGWIEAALSGGGQRRNFNVVSPELAGWVAKHDIAIVGADNEAVEATASRGSYPPFHQVVIRDLGVYLLELLNLAQPAADGVTTGLLVVAPLMIARGVGSPLNPLLIV